MREGAKDTRAKRWRVAQRPSLIRSTTNKLMWWIIRLVMGPQSMFYKDINESWRPLMTQVSSEPKSSQWSTSAAFHRRAYGATVGPGSPSMAETHGMGKASKLHVKERLVVKPMFKCRAWGTWKGGLASTTWHSAPWTRQRRSKLFIKTWIQWNTME